MVKDYMAIFNLDEDENGIRSITSKRPIASTPIASRFRVIDFMLSNVVNAGVSNVGIFTETNSRSLVDHIGDGKPWDLNRKNDGIFIFNHKLTDIATANSNTFKNNMEYLYRSKSENVILTSSYMICNLDVHDVIKKHEASNCDITVVYKSVDDADKAFENCYVLAVDEATQRITGMGKNLGYIPNADIFMEFLILKKSLLIELIHENARNRRFTNFYDLVLSKLGQLTFNAYKFSGYLACINSKSAYFKANMDMLELNVSTELFRNGRPIYTKIKDEPPTFYAKGSVVKNSLMADGNIIRGTVKNSVIGRFAVVEEGAVVENSIVLQNVHIKSGAKLNGAIIDKNVVIEANTEYKGDVNFPMVVEKRSIVE